MSDAQRQRLPSTASGGDSSRLSLTLEASCTVLLFCLHLPLQDSGAAEQPLRKALRGSVSSGNPGSRAKSRSGDMGENRPTQPQLGIQSSREQQQQASCRNACLKGPPASMWPAPWTPSCTASCPDWPFPSSPP